MITPKTLESIYENRPFRTRNADEITLSQVLHLFIDPTDGLNRPFDYENVIIKGKMGTGKTMYLKANLAYYRYTLVPSLMENELSILPIYIKLSDYQNISDCSVVYESIIFKILKEIVQAYQHYNSADELRSIHSGFQSLSSEYYVTSEKVRQLSIDFRKMNADEYIEKVTTQVGAGGSVKSKFLDAFISTSKQEETQIREKRKPKFEDIDDLYEKILVPINAKLLILFDEVGSLNNDFFKGVNNDSMFEILMNQLRTAEYIRTKIAVYPYSLSDILTETRYGDVVELEDDLTSTHGFDRFYNRALSLIESYLQSNIDSPIYAEDIFDIVVENTNVLDQLVSSSNGNTRRFVHLLDMAMNFAYIRDNGKSKVNIDDVFLALKNHGEQMERILSFSEKDFVQDLIGVCKSRGAYKFTFPSKSSALLRLANKSMEYNAINILENGTGRKGTIYMFDYAFCVYKDIPTHYLLGTERLDKSRNRKTGQFIKKVTNISETLVVQSILPGKIEGEIVFLNDNRDIGFVKSDEGSECFISRNSVISDDTAKKFTVGKRIRYIPYTLNDTLMAAEIEIL